MVMAYYAKFVKGHHGALDRIGGLPSHLPLAFPACLSGQQMAFLGQVYCEPPRLSLAEVLCIQLYQDPDVGEGGDPCPVAVALPIDAPANKDRHGILQPQIVPHDIAWEKRIDPDTEPGFPADLPLHQSKVGGFCLHSYLFDESDQFVMQMKEDPGEFNFAGRTCIVCLAKDRKLKVYLA
jgi:hypothetical protein